MIKREFKFAIIYFIGIKNCFKVLTYAMVGFKFETLLVKNILNHS